MTANPLLFVAVTLTLGVILVNGWTDAPNAIATCVVTRCMPPKLAILMAALFNFLGVFVMTRINNEVAVTITSMVNFGDNAGSTVIIVLCAAMLAIVIWATLAGVCLFKERLRSRQWAALAVILVALVLLNI